RWNTKSMVQLASELGHTLLFPVRCRYCKNLIYLFANPNGGFAIFNDVGPPWPKHACFGMRNMPTNDLIPPSAFYSHYDMPVPVAAEYTPYKPNEKLKGSVVRVNPVSAPRFQGSAFDI